MLNIPSIIIYKINIINYLIMKSLVKVKFANIINIINNKEVIPELLQNECNAKEIYNSVVYFLRNPDLMKDQINNCNKTLNEIKSKSSSTLEASSDTKQVPCFLVFFELLLYPRIKLYHKYQDQTLNLSMLLSMVDQRP